MLYDVDEAFRLENCECVKGSGLLQLSLQDFVAMSTQKHVMAGGGNLEQDYRIVLSFLEKNYEVKQQWRDETGLLNIVTEIEENEESEV